MAESEFEAAVDRVFARLDSMSDEELFAALDDARDGPIACAIREAQEFYCSKQNLPLEVKLMEPPVKGWSNLIQDKFLDRTAVNALNGQKECVQERPINPAHCSNCNDVFCDAGAANDPYYGMALAA